MTDPEDGGEPVHRIEATILNRQGLHFRPMGKLVQLTQTYQSEITVEYDGRQSDAKSSIGLVTLGAPQGAVLQFEARGPDAEEALQQIAALVADYFGMTEAD